MTPLQPSLLPCPNPECGKPCECRYTDPGIDRDKPYYQVRCQGTNFFDRCSYEGPRRPTEAEAIRLHNALCAPALAPFEKLADLQGIITQIHRLRTDGFVNHGSYADKELEAIETRLSAVVEEVRGK